MMHGQKNIKLWSYAVNKKSVQFSSIFSLIYFMRSGSKDIDMLVLIPLLIKTFESQSYHQPHSMGDLNLISQIDNA